MGKSVQCKVDGMTCGNCALTVTTYLAKQGASNAVANASTGDVSFDIEDEKLVSKTKRKIWFSKHGKRKKSIG